MANNNNNAGRDANNIEHQPNMLENKEQLKYIDWTPEHEQIMIDWADKALCYKWLHHKAHREYRKKNTWFTIPVIIMSTLTGTANFAQDRISPEYINLATMIIGTINLIAGILTTIQQFLKITELNESHRVSSIAWGKFYRNTKVEISKCPDERTPVVTLLKHSKEEYDRLIETSPTISNHIIQMFISTFSGGEIQYDDDGNEINITKTQQRFIELKKPEICGTIEPTSSYLYKRKEPEVKKTTNTVMNTIAKKVVEQGKNKQLIEGFISSFEKEKKRIPTKDELIDNLDHPIPPELIESVYADILDKKNNSTHIPSETNV